MRIGILQKDATAYYMPHLRFVSKPGPRSTATQHMPRRKRLAHCKPLAYRHNCHFCTLTSSDPGPRDLRNRNFPNVVIARYRHEVVLVTFWSDSITCATIASRMDGRTCMRDVFWSLQDASAFALTVSWSKRQHHFQRRTHDYICTKSSLSHPILM